MNSWKQLISYLKKDFSVTKRDFIMFSVGYSLITILYYIGIKIFDKFMKSNPLILIPFFVFVCLYALVILIIQYYFQKSYSKKACLPVNINKLGSVILKSIKVYIMQFIIYMGFALLCLLVFMLLNFFLKLQDQVYSLIVPIITFSLIIVGIFWFIRLILVNYILIYSRINMKSRAIIQESKYLVKKNLGVIITMMLVCLIILALQLVDIFMKKGNQSINYTSSVIYLVIGALNSYFYILITGNEILEHKYLFLLEPKKES